MQHRDVLRKTVVQDSQAAQQRVSPMTAASLHHHHHQHTASSHRNGSCNRRALGLTMGLLIVIVLTVSLIVGHRAASRWDGGNDALLALKARSLAQRGGVNLPPRRGIITTADPSADDTLLPESNKLLYFTSPPLKRQRQLQGGVVSITSSGREMESTINNDTKHAWKDRMPFDEDEDEENNEFERLLQEAAIDLHRHEEINKEQTRVNVTIAAKDVAANGGGGETASPEVGLAATITTQQPANGNQDAVITAMRRTGRRSAGRDQVVESWPSGLNVRRRRRYAAVVPAVDLPSHLNPRKCPPHRSPSPFGFIPSSSLTSSSDPIDSVIAVKLPPSILTGDVVRAMMSRSDLDSSAYFNLIPLSSPRNKSSGLLPEILECTVAQQVNDDNNKAKAEQAHRGGGGEGNAAAVVEEKQKQEAAAALVPLQVDIVYTYVNGSAPSLRRMLKVIGESYDPNRFRDWDEMRFSLRSVFHRMICPPGFGIGGGSSNTTTTTTASCEDALASNYSSFVRKIFIVVADEDQVPGWLDRSHPMIHIVTHADIFPKNAIGVQPHLPTFNSHAIELQLHRIPGLSRFYIYFNNDMLLGRRLSLFDYFRPISGFRTEWRRQRGGTQLNRRCVSEEDHVVLMEPIIYGESMARSCQPKRRQGAARDLLRRLRRDVGLHSSRHAPPNATSSTPPDSSESDPLMHVVAAHQPGGSGGGDDSAGGSSSSPSSRRPDHTSLLESFRSHQAADCHTHPIRPAFLYDTECFYTSVRQYSSDAMLRKINFMNRLAFDRLDGLAVIHSFAHFPQLFDRLLVERLVDVDFADIAEETRQNPKRTDRDLWLTMLYATYALAHRMAIDTEGDAFRAYLVSLNEALQTSRTKKKKNHDDDKQRHDPEEAEPAVMSKVKKNGRITLDSLGNIMVNGGTAAPAATHHHRHHRHLWEPSSWVEWARENEDKAYGSDDLSLHALDEPWDDLRIVTHLQSLGRNFFRTDGWMLPRWQYGRMEHDLNMTQLLATAKDFNVTWMSGDALLSCGRRAVCTSVVKEKLRRHVVFFFEKVSSYRFCQIFDVRTGRKCMQDVVDSTTGKGSRLFWTLNDDWGLSRFPGRLPRASADAGGLQRRSRRSQQQGEVEQRGPLRKRRQRRRRDPFVDDDAADKDNSSGPDRRGGVGRAQTGENSFVPMSSDPLNVDEQLLPHPTANERVGGGEGDDATMKAGRELFELPPRLALVLRRQRNNFHGQQQRSVANNGRGGDSAVAESSPLEDGNNENETVVSPTPKRRNEVDEDADASLSRVPREAAAVMRDTLLLITRGAPPPPWEKTNPALAAQDRARYARLRGEDDAESSSNSAEGSRRIVASAYPTARPHLRIAAPNAAGQDVLLAEENRRKRSVKSRRHIRVDRDSEDMEDFNDHMEIRSFLYREWGTDMRKPKSMWLTRLLDFDN